MLAPIPQGLNAPVVSPELVEYFKQQQKRNIIIEDARTIKVLYNNELTPFIFGSQDNQNIYKYNFETETYDEFDTYKIF